MTGKVLFSALVLLIASMFTVLAQDSQPGQPVQVEKDVLIGAPLRVFAFNPAMAATEDVLIGVEVVKNAPYSAEVISETIQTLADGNRIVRRQTGQLHRDGEGRTRQEFVFEGAGGPFGVGMSGFGNIISISDPAGGFTYTLHSDTKTAEKIPLPPGPGELKLRTEDKGEVHTEERRVFIRKGSGAADTVAFGTGGPHVLSWRMRTGATEENAETEALGTQVIEGLQVEGKRTVLTIPAGQIGNDLPIVIATEVWYSPELQIVVYRKRDDPLAGQTTYRLTGITRGEPDPALFQPPADYKVLNGPEMGGFRHIQRIEKRPKE